MKLLSTVSQFQENLPQEIHEFMVESFGVKVSHEVSHNGDDLFLFKYSMISADWSHEETHESRGTILRLKGTI